MVACIVKKISHHLIGFCKSLIGFSGDDLLSSEEGFVLAKPLSKGCYIIALKGTQPVALQFASNRAHKKINLQVKPYWVTKYFFFLPETSLLYLCGDDLVAFDEFSLKRVSFSFAKKRLVKKVLAKHYLFQLRGQQALSDYLQNQKSCLKTTLFNLYNQSMQRTCNIDAYYPTWYQQHAASVSCSPSSYQLPLICAVTEATAHQFEACLASIKAQSMSPAMIYLYVSEGNAEAMQQRFASSVDDALIQWVSAESLALLVASFGVTHVFVLQANCLLHSEAMHCMAHEVENQPEAALVYTDSDHCFEGEHMHPLLKPDFDPVLLSHMNYIGQSVVLSQALLLDALKLPQALLGSSFGGFLQALDLCNEKVVHIDKVLVSDQNRPFSRLHDVGSNKKIVIDNAFCDDSSSPLISIIIPTRDQLILLQQAVESILQLTTYRHVEIIIVDNDSQDQATKDYLNAMRQRPNIQVVAFHGEFNFSAINNQAVSVARGEYLCLLNNDVKVITPHWLEALLGYAQQSTVGCVGAKLYYANNRVQHAGVVLNPDAVAQHAFAYADRSDSGYMGLLNTAHCVSAVTGACLMVAKSIYLEVGGLNACDLKVAYNDIDFCLKVMSAGYRNVFAPEAELYHFESISRGVAETAAEKAQYVSERAYMLAHWREQLAHDPYYNPHFSTTGYSYCLPVVA